MQLLFFCALVEETEEPEGNAAAMAYLGVVDTKEAVGLVGNLLEGLATASNLKEVFVVDVEITFLGVLYLVVYNELAVEEGFAFVAFLDTGTKGVHEVGIAQEDLVGLVEVLMDGLEGDVLYGRQVIVDDDSDGLAEAREEVFDGLLIEGVIAVLEIGLEEGNDLNLTGYLHGIAHVVLEDVIEGEGIVGEDSFVG